MKNGSVISTSSVPRAGVSVRAMIQASRTARISDGIGLGQRDADRVEQNEQILRREDVAVAVRA